MERGSTLPDAGPYRSVVSRWLLRRSGRNAFPGQGETSRVSVYEWSAEPGGYVRSETRADEVQQHAVPGRCGCGIKRTADRQPDAVTIRVQQARAKPDSRSAGFFRTRRNTPTTCALSARFNTDTAAHESSGVPSDEYRQRADWQTLLANWLSYGLGLLSDNLPSFVVMTDPRGGPISGASNWTAGYMPAAYQGTLFRSTGAPILDLTTPEGVTANSSGLRSICWRN